MRSWVSCYAVPVLPYRCDGFSTRSTAGASKPNLSQIPIALFPPLEYPTRSQCSVFPLTSMYLPTESTGNFQAILDGALDSYVAETGVDITKHPSADKLQNCHSPEDIILLLLERETAFKDYRDTKFCDLIDRICPAVRVVHALSNVLGEVTSLVCSEALDCRNLIIYASPS